MNRILHFWIFLAFVIIFSGCSNTNSCSKAQKTKADNGLIAYFPFNNNFKDIVNQYEGKASGAKLIGNEKNKACYFDGVNDFIAVEDISELNTANPLTVSLWVAPFSHKIADAWMSKANTHNSKSQWRLGFGWPADKNAGITIYSNYWADYYTDCEIALNKWSHILYTIDPVKSEVELFKDGEFIKNWKIDGYLPSNDPLYFGHQRDDYFFYHGLIDEVRIYNRIIDSTGIQKLYTDFSISEKVRIDNKSNSQSDSVYRYTIPQEHNDDLYVASVNDYRCNTTLLYDGVNKICQGQTDIVHSLLIIKNDRLIFEEYFNGYTWQDLHTLCSATKSITSALFGIAVEKGYIRSENDYLIDYYPKIKEDCLNNHFSKIKISNVLTQTSGLKGMPLDMSQIKMEAWDSELLKAQADCKIGEFSYNELNPEILQHLIYRTSPLPPEEFAKKYLFEPLKISRYEWLKDPSGLIDGGNGLIITPRDMAKFGLLYKNKGIWRGKVVLNEDWIKKSTTPSVDNIKYYGYLWWIGNRNCNSKQINTFEAKGFGGQFIVVVPELDIVIVVTGHVSKGSAISIDQILNSYIIPAFL